MNALVVYDSQFGNTEKVAQAIAGALRSFGQARAVRVDPTHAVDLQGVNLLVVGGPTQNWGATSRIRSFLGAISPAQLRSLSVACFDTRYHSNRWLTGSAAGAMANDLQKKGAPAVAPAESFFVTGKEGPLVGGELERAAAWAQTLGKTVR